VHFDAAFRGVPDRLVDKAAQVEIGAGLAVQVFQNIEVERGGDAGGVVVGGV
jgi:hypothetical protein